MIWVVLIKVVICWEEIVSNGKLLKIKCRFGIIVSIWDDFCFYVFVESEFVWRDGVVGGVGFISIY